MARLTLPSRLELKRYEGSLTEAPWAKVTFTAPGVAGTDDAGVLPSLEKPSQLK
jgi:hypothetical protein